MLIFIPWAILIEAISEFMAHMGRTSLPSRDPRIAKRFFDRQRTDFQSRFVSPLQVVTRASKPRVTSMPYPMTKIVKPDGRRLVDLRLSRGLTQEQLIAEIQDDISKTTLSKMENGTPVQWKHFVRLGEFFKVAPDSLIQVDEDEVLVLRFSRALAGKWIGRARDGGGVDRQGRAIEPANDIWEIELQYDNEKGLTGNAVCINGGHKHSILSFKARVNPLRLVFAEGERDRDTDDSIVHYFNLIGGLGGDGKTIKGAYVTYLGQHETTLAGNIDLEFVPQE